MQVTTYSPPNISSVWDALRPRLKVLELGHLIGWQARTIAEFQTRIAREVCVDDLFPLTLDIGVKKSAADQMWAFSRRNDIPVHELTGNPKENYDDDCLPGLRNIMDGFHEDNIFIAKVFLGVRRPGVETLIQAGTFRSTRAILIHPDKSKRYTRGVSASGWLGEDYPTLVLTQQSLEHATDRQRELIERGRVGTESGEEVRTLLKEGVLASAVSGKMLFMSLYSPYDDGTFHCSYPVSPETPSRKRVFHRTYLAY